jgi:hypothetical protein
VAACHGAGPLLFCTLTIASWTICRVAAAATEPLDLPWCHMPALNFEDRSKSVAEARTWAAYFHRRQLWTGNT